MIYYSYSFNVINIVANKYIDSMKYEQLSLKVKYIFEKKLYSFIC